MTLVVPMQSVARRLSAHDNIVSIMRVRSGLVYHATTIENHTDNGHNRNGCIVRAGQ